MNRSKTKKRFSKRIKNKKIKKQSSIHKYSHKKKTFHKIKGGMFRRPVTHAYEDEAPPSYSQSLSLEVLPVKMKQKLKPIVSRYYPESKCDESVNVVKNGNIIFDDLVLFLNSDSKFSQDYEIFSPEEKKRYIDFYNNEENKKWLGCQIYLMLNMKDIEGYAYWDDGKNFFKWLTHRLNDGDPKFFIADPPFK
jgi:hypothetical protein